MNGLCPQRPRARPEGARRRPLGRRHSLWLNVPLVAHDNIFKNVLGLELLTRLVGEEP